MGVAVCVESAHSPHAYGRSSLKSQASSRSQSCAHYMSWRFCTVPMLWVGVGVCERALCLDGGLSRDGAHPELLDEVPDHP